MADKFSGEYRKQQGVAFKTQGMMRNVKIIVQYDIVWRNTDPMLLSFDVKKFW